MVEHRTCLGINLGGWEKHATHTPNNISHHSGLLRNMQTLCQTWLRTYFGATFSPIRPTSAEFGPTRVELGPDWANIGRCVFNFGPVGQYLTTFVGGSGQPAPKLGTKIAFGMHWSYFCARLVFPISPPAPNPILWAVLLVLSGFHDVPGSAGSTTSQSWPASARFGPSGRIWPSLARCGPLPHRV